MEFVESAESRKGGALGSAPIIVEWDDVRKRSQRTRQGDHMRTDDKRVVLEGNRQGTRDQTGVTEHLDGAGGRFGDGNTSATAG